MTRFLLARFGRAEAFASDLDILPAGAAPETPAGGPICRVVAPSGIMAP